jgi:hypothetical protein
MRNVLFFVLFLCLIMSFCKCKCMCIWCTGIHCIFKGVWNTSIDLLCRNRWAIGMTEIKTIQSEIETIFTNWYIHWPVTLDHSIIYNLGRLVLQCFADKNLNISGYIIYFTLLQWLYRFLFRSLNRITNHVVSRNYLTIWKCNEN